MDYKVNTKADKVNNKEMILGWYNEQLDDDGNNTSCELTAGTRGLTLH